MVGVARRRRNAYRIRPIGRNLGVRVVAKGARSVIEANLGLIGAEELLIIASSQRGTVQWL